MLDRLHARLPEMTALLGALVEAESPSADLDATARCADVLDAAVGDLLGATAERVVVEGRTHLRWSFPAARPSGPRVLLVGHYDTVWPLGTAARLPFRVEDGIARGPGVFDMKAGLVQLFFALAAIDGGPAGVDVLVTADEVLG